jgi:hypothetical protein
VGDGDPATPDTGPGVFAGPGVDVGVAVGTGVGVGDGPLNVDPAWKQRGLPQFIG